MQPEVVATHVARIETDGYTIVEDAVPADQVEALDEDLRRLESVLGVTPAGNEFEGAHTVRIYNLLVHGALYEAIPVPRNRAPGG